jgi:hypothetical protein
MGEGLGWGEGGEGRIRREVIAPALFASIPDSEISGRLPSVPYYKAIDGSRHMTKIDISPKEARPENEIFKELQELCRSPG